MPHVNSLKLILKLLTFARKYWFIILITILATFLYAASVITPFLAIQPLIDNTLGDKLSSLGLPIPKTGFNPLAPFIQGMSMEDLFGIIAWILLPLILLIALFDYLKEYLYRYVTLKIIVDIRNTVCAHIVNLSMSFFNEKKAGDLMSRLTNDVSATQGALGFLFGGIIQQPIRIIMIFCGMLMLNWPVALMVIIFLPLFAYPILKLGRKIRKSTHNSLVKLSDVTESMSQMFSGIRVVKSFRMEQEEANEFTRENQHFLRKALSAARARALSFSVVSLIGGLSLFLVMLGGRYLIKGGFLSIGTAITLFIFVLILNTPVRLIAKSFSTLQESLAGAERIFELMEIKPEIQDAPDAVGLEGAKKGLRFNHLWFAYDTKLVLKDITFEVKPGETIAIVGPTGAGKSTLHDLIARFYDPLEGSIEIDGLDLRKIKRESLLNHLAIVGQESFLFNTTIHENISYGKRNTNESEIIKAAQLANIHEFITSLPEGYQTIVGERGAKLSGGEKQRIAIARAILKNPPILLLDEATSALDAESERIVQAALNNLMQNRTTFVIAHRLYTVQNAHRIIVLDEGRLVAQGTHQELVNQSGVYQKLYQTYLSISSTNQK